MSASEPTGRWVPVSAGFRPREPDASDLPQLSGDELDGLPVITFARDYIGGVPLWDSRGGMDGSRSWLRDVLGLDEPLIDDLMQWGIDMDDLDSRHPSATDGDWREPYRGLDVRARALVERLQTQLVGRFTIGYHPEIDLSDQ